VFVSSHLMSEMEDTADHLVVIGRGRLVADAPIGQVIAGSSHTVVRVRTPAAAQLGRLLAPTAQTVRQESDSVLTVAGLTTDDIGELAHATCIRLHELTLRSASLEQAYLELSRHHLDYGTSQLTPKEHDRDHHHDAHLPPPRGGRRRLADAAGPHPRRRVDQAGLAALDLRQPVGGRGRHRRHRRPGRLGHHHRRPARPTTAIDLASVGALLGQFGLVALAALAITTEFATGSIRTTLAATPARWAVLATKAAVVGAVTFPAGFVATALAILAVQAILGIGSGGILALSARSAAALTVTGLLVVGLGAVLRSTAATITTAVAVLFAPRIIGALVSSELVATVLDSLPAGLSAALASGTGERYSPPGGGPAARRLSYRDPGRRGHHPAPPRPLTIKEHGIDARTIRRTRC